MLLMTALAAVFLCVYVSQGRFLQSQAERIKVLEGQKQEELEKNAELERKIAFAKTDAYVERVARDELGLVKEGEIRFVAPQ